jgi:hypothetical protein
MIDYTRSQWENIDTVNDFLKFCEDPKCDTQNFFTSLIDYDQSSCWTAANVDFDIDIDTILNQEPLIKSNELSLTTMHPTELQYHKDNNFGNGYDRIKPNPELLKIASAIGFAESSSVWVNNQPPGAMMGRHVDSISCFTYENSTSNINEMKYDKNLRQPKELSPIWRCFVALADWQPGQIVNFEPSFWSNWKKGDVVFFDWRHTPHSTANCGSQHRPFLKITGVLEDDEWIINSKKTGQVRKLSI